MNVLSLFDGLSCGRIALDRAGVKVTNYFASEIDKYAQIVSNNNYPDIIRLGDVEKWQSWTLPKIDLIIGGSPCQGFSSSGKGLNFNDPRSKLFFVFVDILKHYQEINPDLLFLLENVDMREDWSAIITRYMGIAPIKINSALVSAQNRDRLYWTNIGAARDMFGFPIPAIEQPKDKGIVLADIIEPGDFPEAEFTEKQKEYFKRKGEFLTEKNYIKVGGDKSKTLMAGMDRTWNFQVVPKKSQTILSTIHKENVKSMTKRGKNGLMVGVFGGRIVNRRKDETGKRADHRKDIELKPFIETEFKEKSNTLSTVEKDNVLIFQMPRGNNKGGKRAKNGKTPTLTGSHWESNNLVMVGVADDVNDLEKNKRIYSEKGKAPALNTMQGGNRQPKLSLDDNADDWRNGISYRKLTPLECERLQTIPDNYTAGVSNSQRYKMIGNAWTVDVIVYLFSYLPKHFFIEKES